MVWIAAPSDLAEVIEHMPGGNGAAQNLPDNPMQNRLFLFPPNAAVAIPIGPAGPYPAVTGHPRARACFLHQPIADFLGQTAKGMGHGAAPIR